MKLNEIIASSEYEHFLSFKDNDDEDRHSAEMIMFKFLSHLETFNDNLLSRKEMAHLLDTSPSYITQLFKGDKLINLLTLAKIERVFNIEFEIGARKVFEKNAKNEPELVAQSDSYQNILNTKLKVIWGDKELDKDLEPNLYAAIPA
jgi:transcriptional regulator with XRE-family HTH domain